MLNRLIRTKDTAQPAGCTDIVDNYNPFGGNGVALYQLNGNTNDVSGNYDGTATNVTYGTGQFGQAGVFNGSSSVVSTNLDLDNFDEEWSISMWVKFTFNTNNRILATSTDNVNSLNGFVLDMGASGELRWRLRNSSGSVSAVSTTGTYGDNQWHNVVIVKSNTTNYIYVNGGAESNSTPTTNGISHSTGIVYGKSRSIFYNGSIDQVRIFNTALDPLEVEALYTEELCICGGTVDTLDILGDGSCIATYQLDGNANDLSGNYSGTPTNVNYNYGEFDLAGVFNGSSSKITNSGTVDVDFDFSVSLWFNNQGANSNNTSQALWCAETKEVILQYMLNNTVSFFLYDGTLQDVNTSTVLSGWNNVVATRSKTSGLEIYLNGISQDVNTSTGNGVVTTAIETIGNLNRNGLSRYFNGYIDQVRIFNKALNSTEVTTLYNETACVKPEPEPISAPDPNLMSVESEITSLPGATYTPCGLHIDKLNGEYFYYSNSNGASNNTGFQLAKMATPYDASTAYSLGKSANTASNSYQYCLSGDKLGYNIVGTGRSNSGVPTGKRVVRFEIQPSWTVPQTPIYNTRFSNYNTFTGMTFNEDGTKMLATNTDGQFIQSILSNPYNIDSATVSTVYNINNYSTQEFSAAQRYIPFGIDWSGDGTSLYMGMTLYNANAGTYGTFYGTTLKCFDASTPYDVTTLSERPLSTNKTLDTWFYGNYDYDISVTNNGKVAIMKQQNNNGTKSLYIFA